MKIWVQLMMFIINEKKVFDVFLSVMGPLSRLHNKCITRNTHASQLTFNFNVAMESIVFIGSWKFPQRLWLAEQIKRNCIRNVEIISKKSLQCMLEASFQFTYPVLEIYHTSICVGLLHWEHLPYRQRLTRTANYYMGSRPHPRPHPSHKLRRRWARAVFMMYTCQLIASRYVHALSKGEKSRNPNELQSTIGILVSIRIAIICGVFLQIWVALV